MINKMTRSKLYAFLPLIVFLGIVIIFASRMGKDSNALPSPFIDKKLPYISGEKLGNYPTFTHQEIGRGRVIVLNVFASWCVPCLQEHPQIKTLSETVSTYGMAWKDDPQDTLKWLEKNGNVYHKILSDYSGRAGIDIGVYGVPETFILDKKGILIYRHTGAITKQDLTQTIMPMIKKLQGQ